ncbi:MAG: hypothetical protein RPT25_13890 [Cycloclasticus sp.]
MQEGVGMKCCNCGSKVSAKFILTGVGACNNCGKKIRIAQKYTTITGVLLISIVGLLSIAIWMKVAATVVVAFAYLIFSPTVLDRE